MIKMLPSDNEEFEQLLQTASSEWIRFGPSKEYCIFVPKDVEKRRKLPLECRKCFKALIFDFWDEGKNVRRLIKMLNHYIQLDVPGKFNEDVVVFYIRGQDYLDGQKKIVKFVQELQKQMTRFGVEGRPQWRVSCKEYQNVAPELFKSTKELSEKGLR